VAPLKMVLMPQSSRSGLWLDAMSASWNRDGGRVNDVRVQLADYIRPEFVDVCFTSVGKAVHDCLDVD
jgi:hypothetical protein